MGSVIWGSARSAQVGYWMDEAYAGRNILPTALAIPSTDSVVHGYRIAMAPDRLLGRVQSVWTTIALVIAPLGPLLAGLLLEVSARATIAVFAACGLLLAVWGTLSRAIRAAPSLDELDHLADTRKFDFVGLDARRIPPVTDGFMSAQDEKELDDRLESLAISA